MFDQLPLLLKFKVKGEKEIYGTLQEAALKARNLSLNNSYVILQSGATKLKEFSRMVSQFEKTGTFTRYTLFNEIEAVPLITENIRTLMKSKRKEQRLNVQEFGVKLYNELYSYLEKVWDSSKVHFMMHSSGYDSRNISGILTKLRKKKGDKWIGKIYFYCNKPDIPLFRDIIKFEGWPESSIICFRENDPDMDYISEAFSFSNLGKWPNDIKPTWPDYYIQKTISSLGYKKEDIQVLSAAFYDELVPQNWRSLYSFCAGYVLTLRYQLNEFETILPFASLNSCKVFLEYRLVPPNENKKQLKLFLSSLTDPKLAEFRNFDTRYRKTVKRDKRGSHHQLSESTLKKFNNDFRKSWYYKVKKLNLVISDYYVLDDKIQGIYKEYMKAAICEFLINQGCTIKI